MRDYSKVAPSFWTGETGRQLREMGRDAQLLALYLITGPAANALGLYHLPIPLACHHTGMSAKEIERALVRASEVGFCRMDAASEEVFVPMMAHHQLGPSIVAKDHRHKWIVRQVEAYRKSKFIQEFHELYAKAFHLPPLPSRQGPWKPLPRGVGAVGVEQEQEQEQEKNPPTPLWGEDDREPEASGSPSKAKKSSPPDLRNLVPSSLAVSSRFLAAWADYVEHRRQKRKALTERTAVGSLRRIEPWGPDRAAAAIEFSIAQGWDGIFEEGGKSGPGPGMGSARLAMPDGKEELYAARTRRVGGADAPQGEASSNSPRAAS